MKPAIFRRAAVVALLAMTSLAAAEVSDTARSADAASDATDESLQPLPGSPTTYEFGETLSGLDGADLEVTYMAAIIPHHQSAIEMAQLELERGESPDIRTHAENIISNQQHQIEQFTRWLEEWHGLTPDDARRAAPKEAQSEMAAMESESQEMIDELSATPAGHPFDVAFVQRMIPHHQAGIVESLEPQARAEHAELRVAASSTITVQQAEAMDFRTWLGTTTAE